MDISRYIAQVSEKPLDRICTDGGLCGIFRTIAVIGDSLSSGTLECTDDDGKTHYPEFYEYSWGQYIARAIGMTLYNFSKGGMTAKEYVESFAENRGYWNPALGAQAYILALGCNDIDKNPDVGSMSDICPDDYSRNADTFAGNYARIIQRYKQIQPNAKFFVVTMPRDGCDDARNAICSSHADLLRGMAGMFENTYVIDLNRYAPVYDTGFRSSFYLGRTHLNPAGYILTAHMISSYIDYIIRHNPDDFAQVGFIGTPYRYDVPTLRKT